MPAVGQGVLVTPPRSKSWVELLPAPWNKNPFVVLVLVPEDAKARVKVDKAGYYCFTTVEYGGREYGLQVMRPDIPKYSEQQYLFTKSGLPMARAEYVGKLEGLPIHHLVGDAMPIVYLRDDMSGPWMNVREMVRPTGSLEMRKEVWV